MLIIERWQKKGNGFIAHFRIRIYQQKVYIYFKEILKKNTYIIQLMQMQYRQIQSLET